MDIEKVLRSLEWAKQVAADDFATDLGEYNEGGAHAAANHADNLSNAIAIIKAAQEAHKHLSHLKDADFREVVGVAHRRAFTAYNLLADALSPSPVSEGEPNT